MQRAHEQMLNYFGEIGQSLNRLDLIIAGSSGNGNSRDCIYNDCEYYAYNGVNSVSVSAGDNREL